MRTKHPESQFVRMVMPDATPEEIAEASRRWFTFLRIIGEIAASLDDDIDSPRPDGHGKVDDTSRTI